MLETEVLLNTPKLFFYSPINFLRKVDQSTQLTQIVLPRITEAFSSPSENVFVWKASESKFTFLYEKLNWDSEYFDNSSFKLNFVFTDSKKPDGVWKDALQSFKNHLVSLSDRPCYCYMDIPTEDLLTLQGLTLAGCKLTETRLTYYTNSLQSFESKRHGVRLANPGDVNLLKEVARKSRNIYDRYHADSSFNESTADEYLATYIEESIKGFADIVLVPNVAGLPSAAFLTGKYQPELSKIADVKIAKMVLSAVGEDCRGWYRHLISELSHLFKDEGMEVSFMNTQSTNRAVIRVWESLGYSYGQANHILTLF